jgi:hypothetical protein
MVDLFLDSFSYRSNYPGRGTLRTTRLEGHGFRGYTSNGDGRIKSSTATYRTKPCPYDLLLVNFLLFI